MRDKSRIIQVSNVALQSTRDQMLTLFGVFGKVDELYLYPTQRSVPNTISSRICYIKFKDPRDIDGALQLTNTVFIDRALIVLPFHEKKIPDEKDAIDMLINSSGIPGLSSGPCWPDHVTNTVDGIFLRTTDPNLDAAGLPPYPNLPATTDSDKVNEIRRTVIFDNIEPSVTSAELLEFAETVGDVKYLRMGKEKDGTKNCLVEYAEQPFIVKALKLHDTIFKGLPLMVNHSMVAIHKFEHKSQEDSQREVQQELERVQTENAIKALGINPLDMFDASMKNPESKSRSRSASVRSHHRSRSPSRRSHKRSRSRRSRSRSADHRRRSASRKSASRRRGRSRSRSSRRDHKRSKHDKKSSDDVKKETSDSEDEKSRKRRKSRSRSRHRRRSRSTSRKRSRSRSRRVSKRDRSRSRSRQSRHRRRSKDRKRSKSSSRSPKRRHRSRSKDRKSKHSRKDRSRSRDSKRKSKSSTNGKSKEETQASPKEVKDSEKKEETLSGSVELVDMDISSSP